MKIEFVWNDRMYSPVILPTLTTAHHLLQPMMKQREQTLCIQMSYKANFHNLQTFESASSSDHKYFRNYITDKYDSRFSRGWLWRMASGMLRRVILVRAHISEERSASFIRVTSIGELGTTLAVTSNRRTSVERDKFSARSELQDTS
jgi:hypothetical protein